MKYDINKKKHNKYKFFYGRGGAVMDFERVQELTDLHLDETFVNYLHYLTILLGGWWLFCLFLQKYIDRKLEIYKLKPQ
jgi:hypothetical protein